jgi:hypothetical protein
MSDDDEIRGEPDDELTDAERHALGRAMLESYRRLVEEPRFKGASERERQGMIQALCAADFRRVRPDCDPIEEAHMAAEWAAWVTDPEREW